MRSAKLIKRQSHGPFVETVLENKKELGIKSTEKHSRDRHHVTERVNLAVVLYTAVLVSREKPPCVVISILAPRLLG